jgi:hypothetical protein
MDGIGLIDARLNQAFVTAVPYAAVLRSWEDRFGARLLRVGLAEFSVLAQRPPRTLDSARHLAAEHWAFCNEFGGTGLHDVPRITASLMSSPVWTCPWLPSTSADSRPARRRTMPVALSPTRPNPEANTLNRCQAGA